MKKLFVVTSSILFTVLAVTVLILPVNAAPRSSSITSLGTDQMSGLDSSNFIFQQVAGGLSLPVFITNAADGSGRIFVVEKAGRIKILNNGSILPTPFLDIHSIVKSSNNEQGLLSLAFHPSYEINGQFFVVYTAPMGGDNVGSNLVLEKFSVSADPNQADATSGVILLTINHPVNSNHNGGTLAFGQEGYLYWSTGDGGGAGDPGNNAQNLNSLLGKILRLNVDSAPPYIPSSNPFYGDSSPSVRKEIWAYGLRNPWRFSFDRLTNDMYIGDVGQSSREEIDFQPAASTGGENYGWRVMEGSLCFNPSSGCNTTGRVLPVAEYDHSPECSVTGGYAYRGTSYPALDGYYFFGDFCTGKVFSLYKDLSSSWIKTEIVDLPYTISTFGEDEEGNLYLSNYSSGTIYQIQYPTAATVTTINRANPNPTNQGSVDFTITFSVSVTGVDISDFSLTTSGVSGATISGVSGSGSSYTVSVNTGSGEGTIGLDLVDNDSILGADLDPLGGLGTGNGNFATGEIYTIDHTAPAILTIVRASPNPNGMAHVLFTVTFSESVTGVDPSDFSLNTTGVTDAAISGVTGSGATRSVSVNTGSGDGSIHLDLTDNDSINDLALNLLNGAGSGTFSTGETYTIDKPDLAAPLMRAPGSNLITNDSTPTFSWIGVRLGQSYEIQVAADNTFASGVISDTVGVLSDTFASPFTDGPYFWRVRAYNASNQPGRWSLVRRFTVDTTGPSAPALTSPADNASIHIPTFRWTTVPTAVSYQFQLDNDADFSSPRYTSIIRVNYLKPPSVTNGIYHWRVRARDAVGNWGAWSLPRTVTVTK